MSSILLLGDAHLRDGDPEVDAFLHFLDTLPGDVTALYLLGDLFDLWIGAPAFLTGSHQRVVEGLRRLRSRDVRIAYVEGNRDYHLRTTYLGDPFDELAEEGMKVNFGGRHIHLAHGDLVNRRDRPYRFWRRLAKGPLLIGAFRLLPTGLAGGLAGRLERRLARTNLRHRIRFPEEECRAFAERRRRDGADTLVLGHFHAETRRVFEERSRRMEVFVLPAWREERRFLRIRSDGSAGFEPAPGVREGASG